MKGLEGATNHFFKFRDTSPMKLHTDLSADDKLTCRLEMRHSDSHVVLHLARARNHVLSLHRHNDR